MLLIALPLCASADVAIPAEACIDAWQSTAWEHGAESRQQAHRGSHADGRDVGGVQRPVPRVRLARDLLQNPADALPRRVWVVAGVLGQQLQNPALSTARTQNVSPLSCVTRREQACEAGLAWDSALGQP